MVMDEDKREETDVEMVEGRIQNLRGTLFEL